MQHSRLFSAASFLLPFLAVGVEAGGMMKTDRTLLWQSDVPFPSPDHLAFPEGATDVVVHRAGSDKYNFLHDSAIVEHKGVLYAAWYNCPKDEIEGESLIRCRRSADKGLTWSEVEVIAADRDNRGTMYVPVAFLSHEGTLHAFVSHMMGHDLLTGWEMFALDEDMAPSDCGEASPWKSQAVHDDLFLPNSAPVMTGDGHYLMAGRMAERLGERPLVPAVARNARDLKGKWDIIPLVPVGERSSEMELPYPETTAIVEGRNVTALVRGGSNESLLFKSEACGLNWSGPHRHNLPMGASKIYAGILSTGQWYAIFNTPTENYRDLLTIAVSRPGERCFSGMWKIRDGYSEDLEAGPEWSYPCAIEWDGNLYVVYTSDKRHCVNTTIPVESLEVD